MVSGSDEPLASAGSVGIHVCQTFRRGVGHRAQGGGRVTEQHPDGATAAVYDRAGFGRPVQRGARPAVVVVDFTYGFTDPRYPTAADMSGPVLATAGLLAAARGAGVPV